MFKLSKDACTNIAQYALTLGFSQAEFLAAPDVGADFKSFYQEYLDSGRQADLVYLENTAAKFDIKALQTDTQSLLVLAHPYLNQQVQQALKEGTYKVARYAWGRDYHKILKSKMKKLLLRFELAGRMVVDSTPLPERYFARRAGLGRIGRSGMLIHQQQGSYFLLAFILLNHQVEADQKPETDLAEDINTLCGDCYKCVEACPTGAISNEGLVDSNLCISYLTIENKKPEIQTQKTKKHRWIFGCDICQTVCPYNKQALVTQEADFGVRQVTRELAQGRLPAEESELFGSPLARAGLSGLKRNIDYVKQINGEKP